MSEEQEQAQEPQIFDERTAFYKELYLFEMDRKDRFAARLPAPIAVATVLASGLLFLLRNTSPAWTTPNGLLVILLVAGAASWCVAVLNLGRALLGYRYGFMPSALAMDTYWRELSDHYDEYPDTEPGQAEDFREFLVAKYTTYSDAAHRANASKAAFLHNAHVALLAALLLLAIAMIPFWLSQPEPGDEVLVATPSQGVHEQP